MIKLTTFYQTFYKSIFSFAYYREVVKAKFSFSLKYFLFLSFLIGMISTVVVSTFILPPLNRFAARIQNRAAAVFPADLVITIKDGQLSTNVSEPLHFPIPFELFTDTPPAITDQEQRYLITIDTKAHVEDAAKSQSIIFITKDTLVVNDDPVKLYPLKDGQDMTVDKMTIESILSKITPFIRIVPILIVVLLTGLFMILIPLGELLQLTLLSLILLFFSKFMQLPFSYQKIYQIALHSFTLPLCVQVFMLVFGLKAPFPFFGPLLFIFYSMVILADLKKHMPSLVKK